MTKRRTVSENRKEGILKYIKKCRQDKIELNEILLNISKIINIIKIRGNRQ